MYCCHDRHVRYVGFIWYRCPRFPHRMPQFYFRQIKEGTTVAYIVLNWSNGLCFDWQYLFWSHFVRLPFATRLQIRPDILHQVAWKLTQAVTFLSLTRETYVSFFRSENLYLKIDWNRFQLSNKLLFAIYHK